MQIQLTNVSQDQLEGLKKNFTELLWQPAETDGKFDTIIDIQTELECWKLFFSGADYCLAKMGRVKL